MQENRRASRFSIHVPLQVRSPEQLWQEFLTGQLRDISRTGLFFHSEVSFKVGTQLELIFCLPAEEARDTCVLSHANVRTLRVQELTSEHISIYGIAVIIDRIDFARPSIASTAQIQ